jgi:class 3 adenylate cyclase
MTATRRLGAIFAADVAGYSRLIGADEAGALQAFKTMQAELFEPKIAQHHRPLVMTTGQREPLGPKRSNVKSKAFSVAQG